MWARGGRQWRLAGEFLAQQLGWQQPARAPAATSQAWDHIFLLPTAGRESGRRCASIEPLTTQGSVGGTSWNGCPPVGCGTAAGLTLHTPWSGAFASTFLRKYYGPSLQSNAVFFTRSAAPTGACGVWVLHIVAAAAFFRSNAALQSTSSSL